MSITPTNEALLVALDFEGMQFNQTGSDSTLTFCVHT